MPENKPFFTKNNKLLIILFICLSIIHVIYASFSQRALYLDGALDFIQLLNGFSDNQYILVSDHTHPRFFCDFLTQLPVVLSYFILGIKSKFYLSVIFCLPYFLYPLLLLLWNYKLSERTKRFDVFVLTFLVYSLCILLFQIFAIVELGTAVMVCMLLFHYLIADIDYTKKDIFYISFFVLFIFACHEFILFVGPVLFVASLIYASNTENKFNKKTKISIGIGGLCASVFVLLYILFNKNNQYECIGFFKEFHDYLGQILNINTIFSIIALICIAVIARKKEVLSKKSIYIICGIYLLILEYMLHHLQVSLSPMYEQHLRTIPCWLVPILLTYIIAMDISKKKLTNVFLTNALSIAIICGMAQTIWQINNTYWWNKNITYMKNELAKSSSKLYIPEEHEEISAFYNPNLRRYIWYFSYASMSIIYSDTYKIKTLLSQYSTGNDPGNKKYREWLFVINRYKFSLPTATLNIKNQFWDASDVMKELDEYNKAHHVKTIQDS